MTGEKPIGRELTPKEKEAALKSGREAQLGPRKKAPAKKASKKTKKTETAAPPDPPQGLGPPEDGDKTLKALFAKAETTEGCPITILGHHDGKIFYLGAAREYRVLDAGRHQAAQVEQLFGGNLTWLAAAFPGLRRELYDLNGLRVWLFRQAHKAGLFDPATPVRGVGIWPGPGGGLVVHCGDAMSVEGVWGSSGRELDGAIYAAAAKIERPAEEPALASAGWQLLEAVRLWAFKSKLGPELILGFIGAAMLGGAPAWRVHMLTSGQSGSGKSWLTDLVQAALGGGASNANNATEAGLRQALSGQARAFVLDEAEGDEQTAERIQAVIQLLRLMSGGAGAKTLRGSAGGVSQAFTVTGCAFLAAILPPVLMHQDRTRITSVFLERLPTGKDQIGGRAQALAAIRAAREASPALRARAIAGWPRFLETFNRYRGGLLEGGADPRDADRIATLQAGKDLLLYDHPPDEDRVADEIDRYLELVTEAAESEDESEGQECLAQLYTYSSDIFRSGERATVAELIIRANQGAEGSEARRQLEKLGLKLRNSWTENLEARDQAWLLVANRHAALARCFEGTRWDKGRWQAALRYLPGSTAGKQPHRFAGVLRRATVIPRALLPKLEEEEEGPA